MPISENLRRNKLGNDLREMASKKVGKNISEMKKGKLKSSSGKKVTDRKQAIAIGLSQARRGKK